MRESSFTEDSAGDWTDSVLFKHVNEQLTQLFERGVTKAQQGYWLKRVIMPVTQAVASYRLPNRACTGGLHRVQIAYDATQDWQDLDEVDERQAQDYELPLNQTGQSVRFVMRSDCIVLLPSPSSSSYSLRVHYYLRPPRVVPAQSSANAGAITAVNTAARTITVNTVPNSIDLAGTQTAITTGSTPIDVVSQFGWHEVQLISETQTLAGSVFTCTGTGDMSTIKIGDLVRAEDQSDFPALPDDFHRALADAAAMKILGIRRLTNPDVKMLLDSDLGRFGDMLKPRVQVSAKAIVAPQMYRGQRRNWLVKYP